MVNIEYDLTVTPSGSRIIEGRYPRPTPENIDRTEDVLILVPARFDERPVPISEPISSSIHLEFAQLGSDLSRIVDFASRYGSLEEVDSFFEPTDQELLNHLHHHKRAYFEHYVNVDIYPPLNPEHYDSNDLFLFGERLAHWIRGIKIMRLCISVWESLQGEVRSLHWLENHIEWRGKKSVFYVDADDEIPIVNVSTSDDIIIDVGDLHMAGKVLITNQLTRVMNRIRHRYFPVLTSSSSFFNHVHVIPTLYCALWFHLFLAIEQNRKFKECAQCDSYFEINVPGRRKTRRYCSDKCRVAHQRNNKPN